MAIPTEVAHLFDLEWTEDEQVNLQTTVERYTSWGATGAYCVHRWRPVCYLLVMENHENCNIISGQWYDEWSLESWVNSPISDC